MGFDGARGRLRRATEDAHLRLHALDPFARLAAGGIGRAEYAALLRRLLGFQLAVEARLAAAPSLAPYGLDIAGRRRSAVIRADLAALGEPEEAPEPAALPAFGSAAAALGCLYVVEGATLGGRMLARGLDHLLDGPAGRRFLEGEGAMWRETAAALERCEDRDAMTEGANATFAAFERHFASTPAG